MYIYNPNGIGYAIALFDTSKTWDYAFKGPTGEDVMCKVQPITEDNTNYYRYNTSSDFTTFTAKLWLALLAKATDKSNPIITYNKTEFGELCGYSQSYLRTFPKFNTQFRTACSVLDSLIYTHISHNTKYKDSGVEYHPLHIVSANKFCTELQATFDKDFWKLMSTPTGKGKHHKWKPRLELDDRLFTINSKDDKTGLMFRVYLILQNDNNLNLKRKDRRGYISVKYLTYISGITHTLKILENHNKETIPPIQTIQYENAYKTLNVARTQKQLTATLDKLQSAGLLDEWHIEDGKLYYKLNEQEEWIL